MPRIAVKSEIIENLNEADRKPDLFASLNAFAKALHLSNGTENEVLRACNQAMDGLELNNAIWLLSADERYLLLSGSASAPDASERERQAQESTVHVSYTGVDAFRQVIQQAVTLYLADSTAHISQIAEHANEKPAKIWLSSRMEQPTILAPLRTDGRTAGLLSISGYSLSQADVPLVEAFASYLSIALENVRLLEAERQRRYEAETLSQATVALTSTLNLDQVLEGILTALKKVVPYDSASIFLQEGDYARVVAVRGFPDPSAIVGLEFPNDTNGLFTKIRNTKRSYILQDAQKDPRFCAWIGSGHVHGWMGIPLIVREEVIGYVALDNSQVAIYTPLHADLAEAFANQAAIAIENARLYEAEGKRAAELEAIRQASLSVTASLELSQTLDAILDSVLGLLPEANNGHIFLYIPENGGRLTFGASLTANGKRGELIAEPRPNGLTYTVAQTGEMVLVPSMREHPLYRGTPSDWNGAIIGLPLKIGEQVVGVMNISYVTPRTFSSDELRMLRLLGDQAAIAIENAWLFQEAETERLHMGLLFDVSRQLTFSLDANEILGRAVSMTTEALGGSLGQAFGYQAEDKCLYLASLYGCPQALLDKFSQKITIGSGMGLAGWVAAQRRAVYIPDVTLDQRWHPISGLDDDIHAAISAPISAGDRLLGVLSVLHKEPEAFANNQLDLLEAICQSVGLALSNADRYQQVQRQLAEMMLIQSLVHTFNQRHEVQVLLDEVVHQLAKRLAYPQIQIFLVEDDMLVLKAYHGPKLDRTHIALDEGIIGQVARTGEVMFVPDVTREPNYQACVSETVAELAVPICREKVVVGVIDVETHLPDQLKRQDRDLLAVLAGQIVVALENAVLYERVRRHADDLERSVARRTAELTELYEFSQNIGYTLSYEDLLRLLLNHLRTAMRCEVVLGCLFIEGNCLVYMEVERPIAPAAMDVIHAYWLNAASRYPKDITDLESSPFEVILKDDFRRDSAKIEELCTLVDVPIFTGRTFTGTLIAASEKHQAFSLEQKRLLATFAHQGATALERLQAIRAAEQRRLEGLVQHLPVGVLLLDVDYRLLVANPLGKTLLSALSPHSDNDVITHLGSYTLQELIHKHAEPLPVEIGVEGPPRRIFEAQARPIGRDTPQWVLMIREVTQERNNQAQIQMQERLATVGQLAAGIAHDFNNIMAAILVYTDLLISDPDLTGSSRERLEVIQQQVHRAASLIRQVLDFSRRAVMEPSSLDLLPFIKELKKMLHRVLPETISIELDYDPGSYMIKADPTRLQQVFMNLALNSRDAMPEGGCLHFELDRLQLQAGDEVPLPDMQTGDWISIEVRDTGCGIASDDLPHIFEPFFTTKPVGQGNGLGLSQVYGIIMQHDGHINVSSRVGQGTQVSIYLPVLQNPHTSDEACTQVAQFDGRGKLVLIAEDDLATLAAMQALLEAYNYEVVPTSNGLEALEAFDKARGSISLVVSDIVMPRMGGIALYQALKERWPEVKILFITGHPLEGEHQGILERGEVNWLQKPFSAQEFVTALKVVSGS